MSLICFTNLSMHLIVNWTHNSMYQNPRPGTPVPETDLRSLQSGVLCRTAQHSTQQAAIMMRIMINAALHSGQGNIINPFWLPTTFYMGLCMCRRLPHGCCSDRCSSADEWQAL